MAYYGYNDNWSTPAQPSYQYPGSYGDHFDETENTFFTHNSDNFFMYPDPIEYHRSSINLSQHMSYSIHNYTNPENHNYDPSLYFSSEIKFSISYSTQGSNEPESTQEFNEPEFKEYDSTPYGGGYDPITTYGAPLPPSDKTCYPRTVPKTDNGSLDNFSYRSIPSPYVTNDEPKTKSQSNPEPEIENFIDSEPDFEHRPGPEPGFENRPDPVHEFENRDRVVDFGSNEDYVYDVQMMPQSMHGSGLEAMDICESIFGYWPCLAKIEQQQKREKLSREICDQESRNDPWNIAADYLFGNPVVYNYENYGQY